MCCGCSSSPSLPASGTKSLGTFIRASFALGPLNGVTVGVILGSGLGYVLGGVLGRTTVTVVNRTEHSLRQASAEELVAGSFGGVIGVIVGAGVDVVDFPSAAALSCVPASSASWSW